MPLAKLTPATPEQPTCHACCARPCSRQVRRAARASLTRAPPMSCDADASNSASGQRADQMYPVTFNTPLTDGSVDTTVTASVSALTPRPLSDALWQLHAAHCLAMHSGVLPRSVRTSPCCKTCCVLRPSLLTLLCCEGLLHDDMLTCDDMMTCCVLRPSLLTLLCCEGLLRWPLCGPHGRRL
jgi:hypothetical protein